MMILCFGVGMVFSGVEILFTFLVNMCGKYGLGMRCVRVCFVVLCTQVEVWC